MTIDSETQPAEQFDDLHQQFHADTMGIWIFLATEFMMFSAVFMGFAMNRYLHPDAFAHAAAHLDLTVATINTAVALTSSFTMALSAAAIGEDRRRLGLGLVGTTIFLGLVFLAIKGYSYWHEMSEGLMPLSWLPFRYDGPHPAQAELFFNLYYILSGMHAIHIAIGVGLLLVVMFLGWRRNYPASWERQVRISGVYWSFTIILSVFVFTALHLLRT